MDVDLNQFLKRLICSFESNPLSGILWSARLLPKVSNWLLTCLKEQRPWRQHPVWELTWAVSSAGLVEIEMSLSVIFQTGWPAHSISSVGSVGLQDGSLYSSRLLPLFLIYGWPGRMLFTLIVWCFSVLVTTAVPPSVRQNHHHPPASAPDCPRVSLGQQPVLVALKYTQCLRLEGFKSFSWFCISYLSQVIVWMKYISHFCSFIDSFSKHF